MRQLSAACVDILDQLKTTVEQILPQDFRRPSAALSESTIGQHLRHTLEFFLCLEKGIDVGIVNYDKRNHDVHMETDKDMAIEVIARVNTFIARTTQDQDLKLEMAYGRHSETEDIIFTNYFRELTYTIEHAIHHMALMKIGIREVAPYVNLPEHFGVAHSTVRFKEQAMKNVILS